MTTAVVVGVLALLGVGIVTNQLFRLKAWLKKPPPHVEPSDESPEEA